VTEDFFDENNETFCPQTPSKPPFPMIESDTDMSIDQVDGTSSVQRPPPMSPKTAEETFGNDTMEYSQVYWEDIVVSCSISPREYFQPENFA
jgi:hypothetical protein